MEAYLDNSATTRVDTQVQELMKKLMDVDFGNPSSRHQKGVVAEGYIKEARQKIAATLKVDPKELIITSGGTESNNMALIGTALAAKRKGNHIITTAVEHPSVIACAPQFSACAISSSSKPPSGPIKIATCSPGFTALSAV